MNTEQTFTKCPGCSHTIRVTKSGKFIAHTTSAQIITKRTKGERCEGSGRKA